MSKIKITECRIVTWSCAKCPSGLSTIERLNSVVETARVICSDCDTAYCLHWGYNGFETWVEEWETYALRHAKLDEMRSQGKQSFE